jgi:hypothetical protein
MCPHKQFIAAFVYYGIVQLIANVDFLGGAEKKCDGARMIFPRENLEGILLTSVAEVGTTPPTLPPSSPLPPPPNASVLAPALTSPPHPTHPKQLPGLFFSLIIVQFMSRKSAFALPMACIAVVLVPLMTGQLGQGGIIACLWLARFFVYAGYNLLWALTPELFPTSSRCVLVGLSVGW